MDAAAKAMPALTESALPLTYSAVYANVPNRLPGEFLHRIPDQLLERMLRVEVARAWPAVFYAGQQECGVLA